MATRSSECQHQFDKFCRQYLQLLAPSDLAFPDPSFLHNADLQEALYTRLFEEGAIQYAPPQRFQLRVMKELLRRVENSITDWEEDEVSENLMKCLATLLSSSIPSEAYSAQQKAYVTYTISSLASQGSIPPTIMLSEARNLLAAGGTTGLRTWEAAFHLGQYLCLPSTRSLIESKTVLELGAGTGYVAILCAKHLGATHVISTDGSDKVVEDMPTNFYLNGLENTSKIVAKDLFWGHALIGGEEAEWNGGRKIDVVLGADITFDGSVIPSLVATISDLFELYPALQVIISATIRNEVTFEKFLSVCRVRNFKVQDIEFPISPISEQEGPFYSDATPIRLCNISKSQ